MGSIFHKKLFLLLALASVCFGFGAFNNFAVANPSQNTQIQFTQAERDWLIAHPIVKVAVSQDYAPISFMNEDGQHVGISADYLARIQLQIKQYSPRFQFQAIVPSPSQKAANDPLDKTVDLVVDFVDTPRRQKYWQFTKPYLELPLHLIVRQDNQATANLNQHGNIKVAVVAYYATSELIASDYPNVELILVSSNQEGLKKVAFGEVDAYVGDLPVASYWSSKAGLAGLKDAGKLPYKHHVSFATNKQEAMLHDILDKALANISAKTRQDIQDRWLIGPFTDKPFFKDGRVWLILVGLLAFAWLAGWLKSNINKTNNRLIKQQNALALLTQSQLRDEESLDKIYKNYAKVAANTLNVERVSIWLFDDDCKQLNCMCLYSTFKNAYSTTSTLQADDYPNYFNALATHRVIAVEDAMQHPFTVEFTRDYLLQNNIGAMLDSTIRLNGKSIGVVCHEHVGGTRKWALDEQNFAGSIADLSRIVMETCLRRDAQFDLLQYSDKLAKMVDERSQLLAQSEKRYNYVLKNAPIPILILKKNGEIVEVNPEAESAFGVHRDDMIGRNFVKTIVAEESRKKAVAMAARSLLGEAFRDVELTLQNINGTKIEHVCSIGMVKNAEEDGQGGQMVAIAQNISQQKMLEASLIKAREAAESADRIKSMFVASMSHELRTPLNSIIGFLGVVLQGMSGELNLKQKDQLGRAYHSAKHLLSLISDVIDISKIEAGFLNVHVEKFDCTQLLNEVEDAVEHMANEKQLDLHIDCPVKLMLETDRKRLYQVVLNVVSNALKYTEKGTVKVAASVKNKQLSIAVEDTGIGIDEAGLASLFKPFERIDSRLRIKTLGTGLGLYLTRKILSQLLGGTIEVNSKPEVGSTFTIVIPTKMPELIVQNASILEEPHSAESHLKVH